MTNPTVAHISYDNPAEMVFLRSLYPLSESHKLITPSVDRSVTDAGRRFVETTFGNTLDLEQIIDTIKTKQGNPDMSEMDAFVYQGIHVIYDLTPETKRQEVLSHANAKRLSQSDAYTIASIYVLNEATKKGTIIINPPNCPRDESCYVGYKINNQLQ